MYAADFRPTVREMPVFSNFVYQVFEYLTLYKSPLGMNVLCTESCQSETESMFYMLSRYRKHSKYISVVFQVSHGHLETSHVSVAHTEPDRQMVFSPQLRFLFSHFHVILFLALLMSEHALLGRLHTSRVNVRKGYISYFVLEFS